MRGEYKGCCPITSADNINMEGLRSDKGKRKQEKQLVANNHFKVGILCSHILPFLIKYFFTGHRGHFSSSIYETGQLTCDPRMLLNLSEMMLMLFIVKGCQKTRCSRNLKLHEEQNNLTC